jgi:hypothetical protein
MATSEELGRIVSTHPRSALLRTIGLSFAIVAAILVVSAVVRPQSALLSAAIGAGMSLSFGILLVVDRFRSSVKAVDLHELGLVVRRRDRTVVLPFDSVDAVIYDLEVGSTWGMRAVRSVRMEVTTRQGERVEIPRGLVEVDDVVRALDLRCTRPLWPEVRSAHTSGDLLTFGPLQVDASGIIRAGVHLNWAEIVSVRPDPDRLEIELLGGQRWEVRVREIPHPRLLVNVLGMHVEILPPSGSWAT